MTKNNLLLVDLKIVEIAVDIKTFFLIFNALNELKDTKNLRLVIFFISLSNFFSNNQVVFFDRLYHAISLFGHYHYRHL